MRDRSVLANPVTEVEHVRAVSKGPQDQLGPVDQRLPAGQQQQRIKIALHRQVGCKVRSDPRRMERLVDPDRIESPSFDWLQPREVALSVSDQVSTDGMSGTSLERALESVFQRSGIARAIGREGR